MQGLWVLTLVIGSGNSLAHLVHLVDVCGYALPHLIAFMIINGAYRSYR